MQRVPKALSARARARPRGRALAHVAFSSVPALVFALSGFARPAQANEDAPRFALAWVREAGADACLDQRSLKLAVEKRLGRAPFSDDAERSIEGSVTRSGRSFAVTLRVRDATGLARGERHLDLETDDCATLSEAVVLAVALTIDPNARATAEAPLSSPSEPALPAPAAPAPAATSSVVPAPPIERAPALTVPERAPGCPRCEANEAGPPLSFSLRGAAAVGILPGVAAGATLTGSVDHSRLRATLSASWFPERRSDDGRFSFGLSTLGAGVCRELSPRGALSVGLCANLQLGAMHAVVHDLTPLDPGDHLFLGAAVGPAFGWRTPSGVQIELGADALFPLVRPEFLVRGERGAAFQSRAVAALAFVGIGIGATRRP